MVTVTLLWLQRFIFSLTGVNCFVVVRYFLTDGIVKKGLM